MLDEDYFDVLHILIPSTAAGIDSAYPPQLAVDSVIVMADMVNGSGEYSGIVFTDTTTTENFHASDIGLEVVLTTTTLHPTNRPSSRDQYCAAIQGVPLAQVYCIAIGIEAWASLPRHSVCLTCSTIFCSGSTVLGGQCERDQLQQH